MVEKKWKEKSLKVCDNKVKYRIYWEQEKKKAYNDVLFEYHCSIM